MSNNERRQVLRDTLAGLCHASLGQSQPRPFAVARSAAPPADGHYISHRLSAEDVEAFHSNGWMRTPVLLTPAGLDALRRETMSVWDANKGDVDQAAEGLTWLQAALLPSIHRASQAARAWYWQGPVVDLVEQLIGPNVKTSGSQLSFKLRGNRQEFQFHQDNQYGHLAPYTAVTSILALDDCTAENGAIRVVDCSHRDGQRPADWSPLTSVEERGVVDDSVAISGARVMSMPMLAGEALLLHC
eukprot:SAG31_NODE_10477_length_1134_cov_0.722705_1_plen_243_part_01